MPRENTHLFFAQGAKKVNKELLDIINNNIEYFYLGSVFPDCFFYSAKNDVQLISDFLHGKDGNLTNKIIFEMLDKARQDKNEKLFILALGFISHCYLDIVFHPVVYYLTGNYYDEDETIRKEAVYRHRHMEVILDRKVNNKYYFEELVVWKSFNNDEIFGFISDKLDIPLSDIKSSLRKQYLYNILFRSKIFYKFIHILHKIRLIKDSNILALFYNHFDDSEPLEDDIYYKDLLSGEKSKKRIKELFDYAELKSKSAMYSAYKYYKG
jgi:hypothetical protein